MYISIHKALAGLDFFVHNIPPKYHISIHKALAGLDVQRIRAITNALHFNPQGPRGPRRGLLHRVRESDNFNPQGPRGPRRKRRDEEDRYKKFQSTRPSRASTSSVFFVIACCIISIHKALAGLDRIRCRYALLCYKFQSTRPSRAST